MGSASNEVLQELDDFESMRITADFQNLTARTEIRDGKRFAGGVLSSRPGEDLSIEVPEFWDTGMVLDVPIRSGAPGHHLVLAVRFRGGGRDLRFTATAKVEEVEEVDQSRQRLRVVFTEFHAPDWQQILGIYAERQEAISEFLAGMKR